MFLLNGNPISLDVAFTHAEIQYPANWLRLASPEERAAIGITEAADPEPYDQRFYWAPGVPKQFDDLQVTPEGDGAQPYTQKGLKSQWISQVKDTAGKLLAQSDWYVTRKVERNVDIPAAVAEKRAAIVAEADRLEAAIAGCADVEELISVVGNQAWPA